MASSTPRSPTILLLNLPSKTFVGIDLASFNSSPSFHGITNIPPGLHFLYTGTDASLSIRHGRWLRFRPQSSTPEIYVLKWDHEQESLDLLDPSDKASISASGAIPKLRGRGLVDYTALRDASSTLQSSQSNASSSSQHTTSVPVTETVTDPWPLLTSHISPRTLTRILNTPIHSNILDAWTLSSISSAPQDTESIPGLSDQEASGVLHEAGSSTLNFTPINLKRTWPEDSVGRDRTDKARDKSWYLSSLIDALSGPPTSNGEAEKDRQTGAKEILAELQFCFLMVLTLANYSCLEQWKRTLAIVFGCKSALKEVEGYFTEVIKVLRTQLGRVEDVDGGLFEMGDEMASSWLRNLLTTFRASVDEVMEEKEGGLNAELSELETWLREMYRWANEGTMLKKGMVDLEDGERVEVQMDGYDEEEESGEYAPVVVEM